MTWFWFFSMLQSPLFHEFIKNAGQLVYTFVYEALSQQIVLMWPVYLTYFLIISCFSLSFLHFSCSCPVEFSDCWWTFGKEKHGLFKKHAFKWHFFFLFPSFSLDFQKQGRDLSLSGDDGSGLHHSQNHSSVACSLSQHWHPWCSLSGAACLALWL